jgi:hypothetical protein
VNSTIQSLGEWTDHTTKQMLHNVVERKQKFDKAKKNHLIVLWTSVFIAFFFFYYVYKYVMGPYSYSFAAMFSVYVSRSFHLYITMVIIGLFGVTKVLYQKKEKAEKEYQALRCEIIDRSKDLWREDAWKKRHQVYEIMKENWDINLFHESK